MTSPIDQLTSLPPTANAPFRSQSDRNAREDENARRADIPARDIEGGREVESRATASDSDLSDFQRHLDDDADNRATQRTETQRAETQDDSDTASQKTEDTHGDTVSKVAITTQAPNKAEPSDATALEQPNKGIIVKTAADNKSTAATDNQTGIKADTGDVAPLQTNPVEAETTTSPVAADLSQVPGDPTDDQPGVPGQSETAVNSAPGEPAPAPSHPLRRQGRGQAG